jgi:hypothetical protein
MTQNSLVGTWKLLSLEFRFEDGQVIYPFGKTPIGYLIYTEQGYISVNIMNANRSPFSSEDITKLSKEEKAAAFETCVAYGGQYEIKGDKVIHYTEVSTIPNSVGIPQEHIFQLTGNRLSLSTSPSEMENNSAIPMVIWERI